MRDLLSELQEALAAAMTIRSALTTPESIEAWRSSTQQDLRSLLPSGARVDLDAIGQYVPSCERHPKPVPEGFQPILRNLFVHAQGEVEISFDENVPGSQQEAGGSGFYSRFAPKHAVSIPTLWRIPLPEITRLATVRDEAAVPATSAP